MASIAREGGCKERRSGALVPVAAGGPGASFRGRGDAMDSSTKGQHVVLGLLGVRYQVRDVQRSIAFYTQTLGLNLDRQNLPACGQVSIGDLKLILSGPGASGSRPMPDGHQQEPGGWNRVVLRVMNLPAWVSVLKSQGVRLRNEMEVGPGGRQI